MLLRQGVNEGVTIHFVETTGFEAAFKLQVVHVSNGKYFRALDDHRYYLGLNFILVIILVVDRKKDRFRTI